MNKKQRINQFVANHAKLKNLVNSLSTNNKENQIISDGWTVKDILAHLAGWNWRGVDEINAVLGGNVSWIDLNENEIKTFNEQEVIKRRKLSFDEVFNDWEESYSTLIEKINSLNENDWNNTQRGLTWKNGQPLTIESLFDYRYEGDGHEGGHANQIAKALKTSV